MKKNIRQVARENNVQYRTVWNWVQQGKVKTERTTTGRLLIIEDEPIKPTSVAVYCRVSSSENKSNLDRQKQRVLDYCAAKGYKVEYVMCEIGSGLNDKRHKLEKLLQDTSITKIVVEHADRFSRFGRSYIELLLKTQGRELEIINTADNDRDDLMQDFVSIITSFTARLYGQRRSKRKTEKIIAELKA
jgi:predicted site-specific integrase-resolvase